MLEDDTLVHLTDSEAHQKAWAAFSKRILYANVANDNRVGFTGAALYPQPFSMLSFSCTFCATNSTTNTRLANC
jgi:hypothetical protein